MTLPTPIVSAYLSRLRLPDLVGEAPSVEGLTALHQAHVRRVPWETAWIHEGLDWGIAPTTSAARIATGRRGGYCYHLNGAFSALLTSLGYTVTRHVGGVHGPDGPAADVMANHMALVVDLDGAPWYVDVGMGDALWSPVPLAPAALEQEPFALTLTSVPADGLGDWHLAHDPRGAFVGMSFFSSPASIDAFAEKHEWLSTSPDSNFVAARYEPLERTWLVGGGSGHGFKHGPAVAELIAATLGGGDPLPAHWALGERVAAQSLRTAGSN